MKRIFRNLLFLVIPICIGFASTVSAVDVFPGCSGTGNATDTDVCQSVPNPGTAGDNPIISGLSVAVTIISIIIGIAAVIVIIVGGLTFITSGGDAQKVAKARSTIVYALVGLIIAALAETIVVFVLSKL